MQRQVPQAAAIPVHNGRICLVTSKSGRRWVIPKGRIDIGHTPVEAATVEAWEEAGLLGTLQTEPVGTYTYEKYDIVHNVTVFVLNVVEIRPDWPERKVRRREWVDVDTAVKRIEEPELQEIVRGLFAPMSTV